MNNNKSLNKEYNNKSKVFNLLSILVFGFILLSQSIGYAQGGDVDPNGFNQFFHKNGKVSSEGNMVNGKPNGVWKTYYDNGVLKSQGTWNEGQLTDNWTFYRADGIKEKEINYVDGKKEGFTRVFDEEGILLEEQYYVNNQRDSLTTRYHKNGKIAQQINYVDGKENGKSLEFAEDGRLITTYKYEHGFTSSIEKVNRYNDENKKVGVWKEFYPDGTIKKEEEFKNGVSDGLVKEYDRNGSLQNLKKYEDGIIQEDAPELFFIDLYIEYHPDGSEKLVGGKKNGLKQGLFREFDQKGNIINGYIFEDDVKIAEGIIGQDGGFVGEWKYYYKSGELKATGQFNDGQKVGEWIYYHKNQKIEQKGKYKKGEATGVWTWYYSNGQEQRIETFRRGEKDGLSTEYDTLGNIIAEGEFLVGLHEGPWFYQYNDYSEKGNYVDGLKEGVWVQTYGKSSEGEEGGIRFKGEYSSGYEEGKHKYYYPNGRVEMEGKYKNGRKIGDWKKYDKDGLPVLVIQYKNGEEYKIDGRKIKPRI